MTVGKMIELVSGKAGLLKGGIGNGTCFSSDRVRDIAEDLVSAGFSYSGKELLTNETFVKSLTNNLKWMCMYLTVPVALAMVASICLLHTRRRTFFQVVFLLPYVIAPIANALIWLDVIYSPVTGLFGFLRSHFGLMGLTSPLTKTNTALVGVAAVDIWHYWGYLCVVYLAALRQTPLDHIEAATLDGCTGWQLFRYIYFPSMLPTFKLMMMLIVIQSFMQFDYVYLLTSGGPANATEMMGTQTYSYAFYLFQFGKALRQAIINIRLHGGIGSGRAQQRFRFYIYCGEFGIGTSKVNQQYRFH